jgi:hypothetical protein
MANWGKASSNEYRCDLFTHAPQVTCIHPDPMANWQQSPRPVLVYNTGSVNVVLAACGTRHAALISRAGELYTWGYGAGMI